MDYTLYTFGGGEVLQSLFTGIAAAVGSTSYLTLLKITVLFGFIYVLIEGVFKQQFMVNVRWLVCFFLVYQVLLVPKVTLHIEDDINHHHYLIDNVPWGLALFASVSSLTGYALTEMAESVFTLPQDLRYSQTGAVMASQLVKDTLDARVSNPTLAKNLQHFIEQCVFYDILLGKYTVEDLMDSADIWDFVSNRTSLARVFKYNSQITTCQHGMHSLSQDFAKEITNKETILGKRLFPNSSTSKQLFMQYLPIGMHYLAEVSKTEAQIMQQALMINAVKDALVKQGAKLNATATIEGFATLRANHIKESTYLITGKLAARWLSLMKNVFEALFYGAFLFLALLFLLPWGVNIFKGYVFSLFWLQSWAPLYAVLNLVMTVNARTHSLAASHINNAHELTLSNLHALNQINNDTIALAGFLSMSIPFIAYGIVKGGASSFTHLASHIGGVSQQTALRASEEMTTGNYSFGNTQQANHSIMNTHGFQYQTNPTLQSGLVSYQLPSGTMAHRAPDNHTAFDSRASISQVATHVSWTDALRTMSSKQGELAYTEGLSQAHHYSDALSTTLREMMDVSHTQGKTEMFDQSTSKSHTGQSGTSVQKVQQAVNDFRNDTHLTEQQSVRLLANAMAEGQLGAGLKVALPEKLAGKVKTLMKSPLLDLSANLRAGLGFEGVSSSEFNEGVHKARSYVEQRHLADTLDEAIRVSKDDHYRSSDESAQRQLQAIGSQYDKAQSYRWDASAHFAKSKNYRDLASLSKETSLGVSSNLSQKFVDWLIEQPNPYGEGKLGVNGAEYILNKEPGIAYDYTQTYLSQVVESMVQSAPNKEQVISAFDTDKKFILGKEAINLVHESNQASLAFKEIKIKNMDSEANARLDKVRNEINHEKPQIEQPDFKKKTELTLAQRGHLLNNSIINAIKSFFTFP